MTNKIRIFLLAITLFATLTGMAYADQPVTNNPQVEFKTNFGNFVVELYPDVAPKTVKNFLQYVKSGFYNDTIFYRVVKGFVIQGGGMDKNLKEKRPGAPIPLEAQIAYDKGLKNEIGVIAMAREEKPNTASSEFFINVANNDFLDPHPIPDGDPVEFMRNGNLKSMPRAQALALMAGYTPFGRVIDGMGVVNQIKDVEIAPRGENKSVPVKTVVVISVKLLKTPIIPKTIDEQLGIKPEPAPTETNATPATPAANPVEAPAATSAPSDASTENH